ncbi:MAG: hypothetical protein HN347_16195 [Bacteroidetes bacterium]|jgi:hypothetical protein|nr:hypothetical protein [Bacteroidota bacterium]
MNKPKQLEVGEWWFKGCFIQKQNHPKLLKYHVFKDTVNQETVCACQTFTEAKALCRMNEVKYPHSGWEKYMNGKLINFLKKNKESLSIRGIERQSKMPDSTLIKAVNGSQSLPKKWIEPLDKFINNLGKL